MNALNRAAQLQDNERERLTARAAQAFRFIRGPLTRAVLAAYRNGDDVRETVTKYTADLPELVVNNMVAAYMQGAVRSIKNSAAVPASGLKLALPNPFEDLLARFEKIVTIHGILEVGAVSSLQETLTEAFRKPALDASNLYTSHVAEVLVKAVTESVREGDHIAAGTMRLREAFDSVGLGQSDAQITTLFRTQTNAAYNGGRMAANQDPALDEIIWGYTRVAVGDDRTTPFCLACDGVTLAKGHPFWQRYSPPSHWNCRCSMIEVFHVSSVPYRQEVFPPPGFEDLEGNDPAFHGNFANIMAAV